MSKRGRAKWKARDYQVHMIFRPKVEEARLYGNKERHLEIEDLCHKYDESHSRWVNNGRPFAIRET